MATPRFLLALAGLLVCVSPPATAQRAHLGFHGGINFDRNDGLAGAQLLLPLGRRVELYPSFDYYFTDTGSLWGLNVDVKFGAVGGVRALYLGGGLNFLSSDGGNDTGGNLFAGLEGRTGSVHPYLEFRVLLHDETSSQLVAGLNWAL